MTYPKARLDWLAAGRKQLKDRSRKCMRRGRRVPLCTLVVAIPVQTRLKLHDVRPLATSCRILDAIDEGCWDAALI